MGITSYIIGGDLRFMRGIGELVNGPASAKMYSFTEAEKALAGREKFMMLQVPGKHGKYYIINKPCFVGEDNYISDICNARQFNTPEEAFEYIDDHIDLPQDFGSQPFVYDSKYQKIRRAVKDKKDIINSSNPNLSSFTKPVSEELPEMTGLSQTAGLRRILMEKASGKCAICGQPIMDMSEASIDHIYPKSLGGSDKMENLQIAHRRCNRAKANIPSEDFYKLTNIISANRMLMNPRHDDMIMMARAIVRGTLAAAGYNRV